MNVLLIGSGGREHALAWKIAQSPSLGKFYVAPGNAGINEVAQAVAIDVNDHEAVISFCQRHEIGLVVVGPEGPLVDGLADRLRAVNIPVFGPSKAAAQLEGSKGFTKDLCARHNIPTAAYKRCKSAADALDYLHTQEMPIVVKADGLAAGKGVIIAVTHVEAEAAIAEIFSGKFGAAGAEVVIEEFMEGEEASFFVLTDGSHALALAAAQDHKRVGEGDQGPNTGGMGAYSPAPVFDATVRARTMDEIILPTIAGMKAEGTPFNGVLFAGLMITRDGPKLIEYNCRFGDPETQVLMRRMEGDILPALLATDRGGLDQVSLGWTGETALTVVMAANGYPDNYRKGSRIEGIADANAGDGVTVFHAGTAHAEDGAIVANGGRVLNVTATGASVREAQARAYAAVDKIRWDDGFCRRDIGWRAAIREGQK